MQVICVFAPVLYIYKLQNILVWFMLVSDIITAVAGVISNKIKINTE